MTRTIFHFTLGLLLICAYASQAQVCADTDGVILVTNTDDDGDGSLRAAIICANNTAGQNDIRFDIPGGDVTISLRSALPAITDDEGTIIDATTQTGQAGGIIIDCTQLSNLDQDVFVFQINGDNTTIMGFEMRNLTTNSDFQKVISYIRIGTDVDTPNFVSIGGGGGKGNILHSITHPEGRVEYHNCSAIFVFSCELVNILSNVIGMDMALGSILGNNAWAKGIYIDGNNTGRVLIGDAAGFFPNYIGGFEEAVVSYNVNCPVTILGNRIGTSDDLANTNLGNLSDGIRLENPAIDIRPIEIRNNIIAHSARGILLVEVYQANISNNKISNCSSGIFGIHQNGVPAVVFDENEFTVNGNAFNYIGGCWSNNKFIDNNVVGYNETGLYSRNSLFCNEFVNINQNISPPIITVAELNRVEGTAAPNSIVELFTFDDCGNGVCQGTDFVADVVTGASGNFTFDNINLSPGEIITATATLPDKRTTNFSECIPLCEVILFDLGDDRPICPGEEIRLSAGNQVTPVSWSTGEITNDISVFYPGGKIVVEVDDGSGCILKDSITLIPDENGLATATKDSDFVCGNMIVTLTGSGSSSSSLDYVWTTMDGNFVGDNQGQVVQVDKEGTYFLEVVEAERLCIALDTIKVELDTSVVDFMIEPRSNCLNDSYALVLPSSLEVDSFSIEWTTMDGNIISDFTMESINIDQAGTYVATLTSFQNSCMSRDSIVIEDVDCIEPAYYIPNAISSRASDPANRVFTIYSNTGITQIAEMQIYDRWGNLIFTNSDFEPNDVNSGWNGLHRNGSSLSRGIYSYFIIIQDTYGLTSEISGTMQLID